MALSGQFLGSTVANGYRLEIDWTATQDIANNQSTITAKVYWHSLGSSYTVSSSATKDGSTTIDGTTGTYSGAGLAGLSGNQRKLIHTYSKTVTHDAVGNKSVSISATFNCGVNLGGSTVSSVSASGTATLNTIPRASTLTSSASWTAGSDFTISVSRASSSFTHTAKIYVNGTLIKSVGSIPTLGSSAFSTAENTTIFTQLAQTASKATSIVLETYNGGTLVGSNTYAGTCTAPTASTLSFTGTPEYNIGDAVTFNITRANSAFTHTLKVYIGSNDPLTSTLVKTITSVGTSYAWTPTSTENTTMYNATPNANEMDGNIQVYTYYNGVQVRTFTDNDIDFHVTNSNPTFGTSYTYADDNATTVAITGDSTKIIQNKSTVLVSLPTSAKATAINGATMVNYIATLNGVQVTGTYSSSATVTFDFNAINASVDQVLSIKAVDSRGNSTTTTKTVTMIPYSVPTITATSKRDNGFDNNTTLTMTGSISLVTVGGVNKNSVQSVQYRYKKTSDAGTVSTWATLSNFTYTTSGSTYTATNVSLNLDNTTSWDVEFMVTDKFGNITVDQSVATGTPIMFVDSTMKNVGINKFPTSGVALDISGSLATTGTITSPNTITGKRLTAQHTGGQYLSLNDGSYVAGTTGMYNYMGFNDGAGTYQAYLGFGSSRDNIFNIYNKIGDIKVTSTTGDILLYPVSTGTVTMSAGTGLNMNNKNITNVNHITINDIGGTEGLEWLSPSGLNNWKIVVTDDAGTGGTDTTAYPLQFFDNGVRMMTLGTGGDLYLPTGFVKLGDYDGGNGTLLGDTGYIELRNTAGTAYIDFSNATTDDYDMRLIRTGDDTLTVSGGNLACTVVAPSKEEWKTDIEEFTKSGLDIINGSKPKTYKYTNRNNDETKIGLIAEEAPLEILTERKDGVDLYSMITIAWKAVQELTAEVADLKQQLNDKTSQLENKKQDKPTA
jgi:hypothetical protein